MLRFLVPLLGLSDPLPAQEVIVPGRSEDHALAEGPPASAVSFDAVSLRVGANTGAAGIRGRNAILVFALPDLPPTTTVRSAALVLRLDGIVGTPAYAVDAHVLPVSGATTPQVLYAEGTDGGSGARLVADDLFGPSSASGRHEVVLPSLRSAIADAYAAPPPTGGTRFLFLRLQPDRDPGAVNAGYNIASADAADEADRPELRLVLDENPPVDPRPSFVVVITDDQRHDTLGVTLREQGPAARFPFFASETPHLDRLASEGARFRNAFAHNSVCSPSRAGFLTSRYGAENRVTSNGSPFPVDSVTHATLLRQAGYATAYVGKWHMGTQRDRPGFDHVATYAGQGSYFDDAQFFGSLTVGFAPPTGSWIDDAATDYALRFLETRPRDRPFLLVVGYKSPHDPRQPRTDLRNLYAGAIPLPAPNGDVLAPWRSPPRVGFWETNAGRENLRAYFRCLRGIDQNVGRLLDRLDSLGLADDTVVVFASDNGYQFGDRDLGDKRSAYEASIRIPLLVRFPARVPAGTVIDEPVLNLDLAPTLLDLAGVPVPPAMRGRSWRPLLEGTPPEPAWRSDFLYEYYDEGTTDTPTVFALRTAADKLIAYPGRPSWNEYFRLGSDPHERANLIADPLVEHDRTRAEALLAARLTEIGHPGELAVSPRDATGWRIEYRGAWGGYFQLERSTELEGGSWTPLHAHSALGGAASAAGFVVDDRPGAGDAVFYRVRVLQNQTRYRD